MVQRTKNSNLQKDQRRTSVSRSFVLALSIVSIIGFMIIVLDSLFYLDISEYQETLLLIALGVGLIMETSIKEFKQIKKKGLTSDKLGKITMVVVGFLSIIAGFLSIPQIQIEQPTFLAIKGIISILAIIFIIIETWIIE